MKKSDFHKTALELESDSCFELLPALEARIAEAQAKLALLRETEKSLEWGSVEERVNYTAQRQVYGELEGLAYAQGAVEGQCQIKTSLAAVARRYEGPQEAA